MLGGGTVVAEAAEHSTQQAAKTVLFALCVFLKFSIPCTFSVPDEFLLERKTLW
jgi:hypothetical protein